MKLRAYSIFDVKVGSFMRPFFCQTDGEATRVFSDLAADDNHQVGRHPEDYSLHRIGQYDDNNGEFTDEINEQIATALEVRSNEG